MRVSSRHLGTVLSALLIITAWQFRGTASAEPGGIISGNRPPVNGGFGTFAFGGGTCRQLLDTSGCPSATSVFFYNRPEGTFAIHLPGADVVLVNQEIPALFPDDDIPRGTIFTARCVSPTLTTTSHPEAAQPAPDLLLLQDQMTQAIADYWVPGRYSVAVTDLQTGETVSVNGDEPHLAGCVVNLFALYQAVRDVWANRYPLDMVESLISATIWSSNATTAHELYGIIGDGDVVEGVRRVERLTHDGMGLSAVVLDHPPAYNETIGAGTDNLATVHAMNQALADLWRGEAIPEPSWRAFLLQQMTVVKPGLNYLTAVIPEVVSHKNGFMWASTGYVDNDVGIVRLQRDGTVYAYAISFFSESVEVEYADIPLGQQLMYLAYEAMIGRYPE